VRCSGQLPRAEAIAFAFAFAAQAWRTAASQVEGLQMRAKGAKRLAKDRKEAQKTASS